MKQMLRILIGPSYYSIEIVYLIYQVMLVPHFIFLYLSINTVKLERSKYKTVTNPAMQYKDL